MGIITKWAIRTNDIVHLTLQRVTFREGLMLFLYIIDWSVGKTAVISVVAIVIDVYINSTCTRPFRYKIYLTGDHVSQNFVRWPKYNIIYLLWLGIMFYNFQATDTVILFLINIYTSWKSQVFSTIFALVIFLQYIKISTNCKTQRNINNVTVAIYERRIINVTYWISLLVTIVYIGTRNIACVYARCLMHTNTYTPPRVCQGTHDVALVWACTGMCARIRLFPPEYRVHV